jgi:hypothetical protein
MVSLSDPANTGWPFPFIPQDWVQSSSPVQACAPYIMRSSSSKAVWRLRRLAFGSIPPLHPSHPSWRMSS